LFCLARCAVGRHHDLALEQPAKAREILAKMKQAETHWFNPGRGRTTDPSASEPSAACKIARETGALHERTS
jgi:hypothetical protein